MSWNPFSKSSNNNNQSNYGGRSRQSNNRSKRRNGNSKYNPYADNGRQGKYDNHQHNHCHNHQYQAKAQKYVNTQSQATAQTQTFREQVDDMIEILSLAGASKQNGAEDAVVNALCDGAVVSLNMFAVSCEQLHQENNKDALDIGRKRVHDKLSELAKANEGVFSLIEPHRNFIIAALDGQKDLRYKESRVKPGAKALFERDPQEITGAFAKMIHHQQKFNKSREALLEPQTNKRLAKQHQSELEEYRRNNKKYGNRSKNKSKSGSNSRPQINNLFLTKSGKESKFIDARAMQRAKREEKAMDEDLCPSEDAYDYISPQNAVLKLSKKNSWNGISYPFPCLILDPKKHREREDKRNILIQPAYPAPSGSYEISPKLVELDEDKIIEIENEHIAQLRARAKGVNDQKPLGYQSIAEQKEEERKRDLEIMCGGFSGMNIDGNNSDSNL